MSRIHANLSALKLWSYFLQYGKIGCLYFQSNGFLGANNRATTICCSIYWVFTMCQYLLSFHSTQCYSYTISFNSHSRSNEWGPSLSSLNREGNCAFGENHSVPQLTCGRARTQTQTLAWMEILPSWLFLTPLLFQVLVVAISMSLGALLLVHVSAIPAIVSVTWRVGPCHSLCCLSKNVF